MSTYYTISEISKELSVEPHVLRNWESELALTIKRSHNGHRIYTPEDYDILVRTKDLKIKGFTLKQIRLLIPWFEKLQTLNDSSLFILRKRLEEQEEALSVRSQKSENQVITLPVVNKDSETVPLADSGKENKADQEIELFDIRLSDMKNEPAALKIDPVRSAGVCRTTDAVLPFAARAGACGEAGDLSCAPRVHEKEPEALKLQALENALRMLADAVHSLQV